MHDPIALALAEDIGTGDLTCQYFVPADLTSSARIIAKEKSVLAGIDTCAEVFSRVDPGLKVTKLREAGSRLVPGDPVIEIQGPVRSILTAERVALNFLQRLSGIATLTSQFVEYLENTKTRILDTRKTTPGLRALEKAAVCAGGGHNHRMGLYDMVMVKDNHLVAQSDPEFLQKTIHRIRAEHPGVKIELEADTLDQVRTFLKLEGVDIILLDNMSTREMHEAVHLGQGRVQFEASGGVTLKSVARIARTGVDFISIGALTHSARSIDFSLELL